MRIAPVLIPHVASPSKALWADTALCAMLTHNNRASIASCLSFVRLLWVLLDLEEAPRGEWWVEEFCATMTPLEGDASYETRHPELKRYRGPVGVYASQVVNGALSKDLDVLDACDRWHSGAYLLETVPTVLYILARHGDDPVEAIVRAVNDTKDNDTIAAIVGAAVGALHGKQAFPERWVENLLGRTGASDDGYIFELIDRARERWS